MKEGLRQGNVGRESKNLYFEGQKYPEPTICPKCDLVYRAGRWQHKEDERPAKAQTNLCPACRRKADRYPGGLLQLSGQYLSKQRTEIINIANNQARAAASTRPLHRIMWMEDKGEYLEIATTTEKLAMRIGKAIYSACKGKLEIKKMPAGQIVRIYWHRDE